MFYTRIPCPPNIDHSEEYINKATRYFPLIGWIVGAISCAAYCISAWLFNTDVAIIFSLLAGLLTTGAFHEDGLADVFDGFGGGWTKAKILDIMKDSRVGAYGVVSLVFLFLIKFVSLQKLPSGFILNNLFMLLLYFISYHALARLTAIIIVFTSQYSREDESSKAKPIAKAHSSKEIVGAFVFGLIPLTLLCIIHWWYILILIPLALLYSFSKKYFEKWIDGYTGDCLGAVEQLAECTVLLSFVALWKFM
jgi:adenosylcobinamide-GDP ribazoletransferase